jgi:hypothetical protein
MINPHEVQQRYKFVLNKHITPQNKNKLEYPKPPINIRGLKGFQLLMIFCFAVITFRYKIYQK